MVRAIGAMVELGAEFELRAVFELRRARDSALYSPPFYRAVSSPGFPARPLRHCETRSETPC